MTPVFLFPRCEDCGETLASPSCNCPTHVCIKPNAVDNASLATKLSRLVSLIAPPPELVSAKLAEAA